MKTIMRTTDWGTLELSSDHIDMKKDKVDRLIALLSDYFIPRKIECAKCKSEKNLMHAKVTMDEDVILFDGRMVCQDCNHEVPYNSCGDPLKMAAERQKKTIFEKENRNDEY
ncbi:hypothetical protein LCGC14_2242450 [marine sediment metagenome]|uniref:Uncharacterized protein n=1 Tax=marine sediment metagenome TaxID=412755 RepID=A0A0F9FZZ8_9ZZZZ